MKKIKLLLLISFFSISAILVSGCRESDSTNDRKARLIGNQNLELKKQLQEKDVEIEKLKNQIAECKTQTDKNALNFMKILSETSQEIQNLKAENTELKEKLKQLEEN